MFSTEGATAITLAFVTGNVGVIGLMKTGRQPSGVTGIVAHAAIQLVDGRC